MELILRAYDHETVLRAEALPVERLYTLLESGGMRDAAMTGAGLTATADIWARETVVERLASLIQEGYGQENLARLRGGEPPDLVTLRKRHWPPIKPQEAVDLREDLVRYQTYGLWQAPEESVARVLATLTGRQDAAYLLGDREATSDVQEVLDLVEDDVRFAERFGPALRVASRQGKRGSEPEIQRELASLQQFLGPIARLRRDALRTGLRTIVYHDQPGGDGLTRFLAEDMQQAGQLRATDVP